MDVLIGEIVSTIKAIDTERSLPPEQIQTLVSEVMRAVDEREEHRRRVKSERSITRGIAAEMEGEA